MQYVRTTLRFVDDHREEGHEREEVRKAKRKSEGEKGRKEKKRKAREKANREIKKTIDIILPPSSLCRMRLVCG